MLVYKLNKQAFIIAALFNLLCLVRQRSLPCGRDAGQLLGASYITPVNCTADNVSVAANGTGTGANIRADLVGRVLG